LLRGASGRDIPGADSKLPGAVPAETLVSVYGAHLREQAAEDPHMPTVEAAPSSSLSSLLPFKPQVAVSAEPPADRADHPLVAAKRTLRAEARIVRDRAAAAQPGAGLDLRDRFLAAIELPAQAVIGGYWPIRSEIDVRPLLTVLAGRGLACALPRWGGADQSPDQSPLAFHRWQPGAPLVAGRHGLLEPDPRWPPLTPSVLLVPLLAFDRAGYRLGYGAGCYDRTLPALRRLGPVLAVGVAFAAQEVAAVPRDRFDQRLDALVTEAGVLRFPTDHSAPLS